MNTRAPAGRSSKSPAPAILVAAAALMLLHGSALADCRSHDPRPSIPLGRAETAVDRPDPPARPPSCTGPHCPRMSLPPIVATHTHPPRQDITGGPPVAPIRDRQSADRVERPDGLDPIGRVTEIERPPCRPHRPAPTP